MSLLDWNLAEALNVYQIALLSAGYDPAEYEESSHCNWSKQVKLDTAVYLSTIKTAVLTGKVECEIEESREEYERGPNWYASLIDIKSYTCWLKERNHQDKFFNCDFWQREDSDLDRLLAPSGEFYPPKLAAAVRAWQAVTADPIAIAGKSPKRALEVWLRKHANEYGLANKDGKPNEQGIEEVCKVANWKPQGGASRTPHPPVSSKPTHGSQKPTHPLAERGGKALTEAPAAFARDDLDDEIPF